MTLDDADYDVGQLGLRSGGFQLAGGDERGEPRRRGRRTCADMNLSQLNQSAPFRWDHVS